MEFEEQPIEINNKRSEYMKEYGIEITYSWGDEEPIIKCKNKKDAWEKAKKMAVNEAKIVSEDHECEIGLIFNKEENKIILHYTYDDEYCYYKILPL